jgi:hypothetical protein
MSKSITEIVEESRKLREKSRRLREGFKENLPQPIAAIASREAIAEAHKVMDSIKTALHKNQ